LPASGPPQPGDVLVFRFRAGVPAKHTGLLATPATFVHAVEGCGVVEVPLVPWWRRRIAGVFSFPGIID
jgi:NlpC/P60 family putative phage cell wall peptidase